MSNAFTECVKAPRDITSTPVLEYSAILLSFTPPEASNNTILLFFLSLFLFFKILLVLTIAFLIIEAPILSNMIANDFFDFKLLIVFAASSASFSFFTSISIYLVLLFLSE